MDQEGKGEKKGGKAKKFPFPPFLLTSHRKERKEGGGKGERREGFFFQILYFAL